MSQLEQAFIDIGFARFEVQCLFALARHKKATTKRLSRETNITYNLTKVMLQSLEKRRLVTLCNTPDQDTYEFAGIKVIKTYLASEKDRLTGNYEAAEAALEDL